MWLVCSGLICWRQRELIWRSTAKRDKSLLRTTATLTFSLLTAKRGEILQVEHAALRAGNSECIDRTRSSVCRFPGLAIWLRDGSRVSVQVPQGHVLIQAGKQLEYLTGGYIHAGKHEVVVDSNSVDAINRAKEERRRLWRVSSTFFAHCNSDAVLEPLGSFRSLESLNQYPPIKTGDFVRQELQAISLRKPAICH